MPDVSAEPRPDLARLACTIPPGMPYELWDLRSNNLINSYDSEDEVRRLIREALAANGELAVEWLMVVADDPNSDYFRRIGIGSDLLAYVRDAA